MKRMLRRALKSIQLGRADHKETVSSTPENDARWDESRIQDEWFREHFSLAARVVEQWLSGEEDLEDVRLLDFGCGDGYTDLGIALRHPTMKLTGVDITANFHSVETMAREQIGLRQLPDNLDFQQIQLGETLTDKFQIDAICSWSAFEHVERPHLEPVIKDLFNLLPPRGLLFVQIEPLYYSPFGSHLGRFLKEPWAHLLLAPDELKLRVMNYDGDIPDSEKELNYRTRSFTDYKQFIFDEYTRLNRLTADELVSMLTAQGFELLRQESTRMKQDIPEMLLETHAETDLRTNEIRVLLRKP